MLRIPRKLVPATIALAIAAALPLAAAAARPDADPLAGIDVSALVAQAKDMASRALAEQPLLLALDDEATSMFMPSPAFVAREFGNPREVVKNAPYTAEAVIEFVQTLPDGNRIVRKSTTLLARDTMGRTRQERTGDGHVVYVYDPLEGKSFAIDAERRTATQIPRVPAQPEPPAAPVAPTPPAPPPAGGAPQVDVSPGRVVVRRGAGDGAEANEVRIEVVRVGQGEHVHPVPPLPPIPPITLPILPRGKGETKSLGTREFDGIKADGTLTTQAIPAGAIGNEKPIVVSTERWFSPELFVVVYAKSSDPRAGDTTYRLVNVKRGEPPADLFKLPADVKVRGSSRR